MNKAVLTGSVLTLALGAIVYGFSSSSSGGPRHETSSTQSVPTTEVVYGSGGSTVTSESTLSVRTISTTRGQVLFLDTEVNKPAVDKLIDELEEARSNGEKRVYIVIDSPGGSVLDGAKLISYMKSSKMEINTVCETLCASMAFHIFESGAHRLMIDKAVLMAHPASGGAQGTLENMKAMIDMFKTYVDRLDADVAKRSGLTLEQFKLRVLNNMWLEARDAVQQKFADELVTIQYSKPVKIDIFPTSEDGSENNSNKSTKRIVEFQ